MTTWCIGGRVVLNDFGLAKHNPPRPDEAGSITVHRMHTQLGTLDYAAPEVSLPERCRRAREGYDASVDIWSIGAVTAMLLTAELPSYSLKPDRSHRKALRHFDGSVPLTQYDLTALDSSQHSTWSYIAARPKDFVKRMLNPDPSQRPSAVQALQHTWFTKRIYKQDMDAIYERAIRGWQPSPASIPKIVDISHLGPGPLE